MKLVVLLASTLLAGCVAKDRIRADDLARALAEQRERYYIVDVRSTGEFEGSRGHIEGAVPLPWPKAVRERSQSLSPASDQTVVLICLTGHRSRWAMNRVRAAVPNEVIDLKGGMLKWWGGGYPVVVESR